MNTSIELQNIDCNCNNCVFMERDLDEFKKWAEFRKQLQYKEFESKKNEAIEIANNHPEEKSKHSLLRKANKMTFQFDKSDLINYGNCKKYHKSVSFIPNICQIETQDCFENRRK